MLAKQRKHQNTYFYSWRATVEGNMIRATVVVLIGLAITAIGIWGLQE